MAADETKPLRSHYLFKGFDLYHAALARQILIYGSHPIADCINQVYAPTRTALEELAKDRPRQIILLDSDRHRTRGMDGEWVNLDLVRPNRGVFHLGTIADRKYAKAAHLNYNRFLITVRQKLKTKPGDFLDHNRSMLNNRISQAKQRGPFVITKSWNQCLIPVDFENLSREAITHGLHSLFNLSQVPLLTRVPLRWLKDSNLSLADALLAKIDHLGRRFTIPQTRQEREQIFFNDILDA